MESNIKNKGLIIIVVIIIIAVIILISSSYALWILTKYQTTNNVITTSCFEVEFTELSNAINLTNAYPVTDSKGLKSSPYTFKIKNICDTNAKYKITLNTLEISGNKIPDNLIKYVFYDNSTSITVGNYLANAQVNTDTNDINTSSPIITSYEMASGTLAKNEEIQYMLKLWIDESATTEINGYGFESSINVTSYAAS